MDMSKQKSKTEPKYFRLPDDLAKRLEELTEELDKTKTDIATKSMRHGMDSLGWSAFGVENKPHSWFASLTGEVSKALAAMGVAFIIAANMSESMAIWVSVATLGAASLGLLVERNAAAIHGVLKLPDHPPWTRTSGGESE